MSNQEEQQKTDQTFLKQIGERIKCAREEIGYSQRELGDALCLSDRTVSAYEVGRAQPSLKILQELSRVTHRPISYFLDEDQQIDFDLQLQIKKIEQELLEVKKLISKKK